MSLLRSTYKLMETILPCAPIHNLLGRQRFHWKCWSLWCLLQPTGSPSKRERQREKLSFRNRFIRLDLYVLCVQILCAKCLMSLVFTLGLFTLWILYTISGHVRLRRSLFPIRGWGWSLNSSPLKLHSSSLCCWIMVPMPPSRIIILCLSISRSSDSSGHSLGPTEANLSGGFPPSDR